MSNKGFFFVSSNIHFVFFTLLFSCHFNMTSLPVASSIRASFGGRAGSAVCVYSCVCPCVCVHDLSVAPNIVQWRDWICRELSHGSSISPILNFSILTAVTIQGLMSPHVLASPYHSPHPASGRDSHSFSSLHKKSLSVWLRLLSLLLLLPLPVFALSSFYSIPLHWAGEKRVREEDYYPHCLEPAVTLYFIRRRQGNGL